MDENGVFETEGRFGDTIGGRRMVGGTAGPRRRFAADVELASGDEAVPAARTLTPTRDADNDVRLRDPR